VRTIVLATSNPGKVREFRQLLARLPLRIVGLDELGLAPPPETGATFAENAALKARAAALAGGRTPGALPLRAGARLAGGRRSGRGRGRGRGGAV
jgi:hypothetical protein